MWLVALYTRSAQGTLLVRVAQCVVTAFLPADTTRAQNNTMGTRTLRVVKQGLTPPSRVSISRQHFRVTKTGIERRIAMEKSLKRIAKCVAGSLDMQESGEGTSWTPQRGCV